MGDTARSDDKPRAAKGAGKAPKAPKRKRAPSPPSPVLRRRIRLAIGIVFGVALSAAVALAITLTVFSARKGPGEATGVVVDIPKGATKDEVARILADEGLVSNPSLMRLYWSLSAHGDPIAGEHVLLGGSTPDELALSLTHASSRKKVKVVIPEGFNRFAIAERLERLGVSSRRSFLGASSDPLLLEALEVPAPAGRGPASAEGFLFPATYELQVDSPAADIVERLVRESNTRWKRLADEHKEAIASLAERFGWSRAEIVTLASMVEKEAAVDDERPTIAGVFLNRLAFDDFKPKLLQSDPTSGYGCLAAPDEAPSCVDYAGKITPAINRDKLNRYSTYSNEGLPPGPIANPGERSLLAVLDPSVSRFLYFVAVGGGRHKFSETLEDHNRAIHK
ncbi:MAG: endolytic transglycosylase MltG [Polyangiaceae bacterium]|nr:endolytic transglycosylase MltG [Polyangiaceae bacterium]